MSVSVSASSSSTGGTTGGVIISESPDTIIEAETSVAAGSNNFVVASWIAVSQTSAGYIGYSISTDDGASWGALQKAKSPGGREASDPVLAVDGSNDFFLTWVGYHIDGQGNPTDMHVYMAIAPSGQTSFQPPVEVSDPNVNASLYDKPWVSVTNTGTLIVTYASASNQGYAEVAARSTDLGATWKHSNVGIDPSQNVFRNLGFPCAPKSGSRIYVTYMALTQVALEVHLAHSDDDGVTWNGNSDLLVSQPNEQVSFDDPTCVASGNEVWVLYGLSSDPPDVQSSSKSFALKLAHSGSAGDKVDAYTDAHDKQVEKFFIHATLAMEDTGALDIVYYAGNADKDDNGSYRRARAAPPAGGFSPSVVVEQPNTFLQARGDPQWLGDYTGVFMKPSQFYTTFVNNTSGFSHIEFAGAKGL